MKEEVAKRIASEVAPRIDSKVVDRIYVAVREGTEEDPEPVAKLVEEGEEVYVVFIGLEESEDSGADRTLVNPRNLEAMTVDLMEWAKEEFEDVHVLIGGVSFVWKGGSFRDLLRRYGEDPDDFTVIEEEAVGIPPR
ncbi:hypothetical protein [Methanopyrus kandleri]